MKLSRDNLKKIFIIPLLIPFFIIMLWFSIIYYVLVFPLLSIVFFFIILPSHFFKNDFFMLWRTYLDFCVLPFLMIKDILEN